MSLGKSLALMGVIGALLAPGPLAADTIWQGPRTRRLVRRDQLGQRRPARHRGHLRQQRRHGDRLLWWAGRDRQSQHRRAQQRACAAAQRHRLGRDERCRPERIGRPADRPGRDPPPPVPTTRRTATCRPPVARRPTATSRSAATWRSATSSAGPSSGSAVGDAGIAGNLTGNGTSDLIVGQTDSAGGRRRHLECQRRCE